jgi:hypothetical protein
MLAGVQMPKTDGRVLREALAAPVAPPTAAAGPSGRPTGRRR